MPIPFLAPRALPHRATPTQIVGQYRSVLRRALPRVDVDQFHIHSNPLPIQRQAHGALKSLRPDSPWTGSTNVITISPPTPRRVIAIEDGNNGSFATAAVGLLPPILLNTAGDQIGDTAVIYHENLGHAPHVDPITSVEDMFDAFVTFYYRGFREAFEALPFLSGLPIHELGFSRGAGFMVYAHDLMMTESGPHAIWTSEENHTEIATSTLISPAIRMNRFMEWASLFSFFFYLIPPKWIFPPGIDKESTEGRLIQEFTREGIRSTHMGRIFARDFCGFVKGMAQKIRGLNMTDADEHALPYPPTLLAVSPEGDGWIDMDEAMRHWNESLNENPQHVLYRFQGHHNPFGNDEGRILMRRVRQFWERHEG